MREPDGSIRAWDLAAWGVPINQEDMMVTQLAFTQVILLGLERMGVRASWEGMEDYLHMWKLIGCVGCVRSASWWAVARPPPRASRQQRGTRNPVTSVCRPCAGT